MTRTTETVSRRDWDALIGSLDGDTQQRLAEELASWDGGATCEAVEYTADSLGRIDSESSPRPGTL